MIDIKPTVTTDIKNIPVANKRIIKETAGLNKVEISQVEDIIKHVGSFVRDTMKNSLMETVMLPEFGKFKPKQKALIGMIKARKNKESGMDELYRALKGKKLINKTNTNETISD